MKQYITPDQAKELTAIQQQKLVDIWAEDRKADKRRSFFEWLTIGKMIEILEIYTITHENTPNYDNERWIVQAHDAYSSSNELCDALWEAVKEVL